MKEKKKAVQPGFLFVEVIVAIIILSVLVGAIATLALFIKKQEGNIDYRYTALNLAREVLEFGEGIEFSYEKSVTTSWPNRPACGGAAVNRPTPCGQCSCTKICERCWSYSLTYQYDQSEKKYIYTQGKNFSWLYPEIVDSSCSPYPGSDSYSYSASQNDLFKNPFNNIGDIKAKKMVPEKFPESVKIVYTVIGKDPFSKDYRRHAVHIEWKNIKGAKEVLDLATVPLNRVNDSLKLKISDFRWEKN